MADATTLAYVFWHAPRADVAPVEYEARLGAFHASLADHPPNGLRTSAAYRCVRTPWTEAGWGAVVYVDWYVVDGWAALGELTHDAVAPPHAATHDPVAGLLEAADAGIYRLRRGGPDLPTVRFEGWIDKASGVPSEAFAETLAAPIDPGSGSVWQRQLALGPAPEFVRRTRRPTEPLLEGEGRIELRPVGARPTG